MKYLLAISLIIFTPHLTANENVPVIVGSDDDMDACMTLGLSVTSSNQNESVVRAGPSTTAVVIDKIKNGHPVWMCSFKKEWIGVVYSTSDKIDCGVSRFINPARPYQGPCHSGWMHKTNVEPAAG